MMFPIVISDRRNIIGAVVGEGDMLIVEVDRRRLVTSRIERDLVAISQRAGVASSRVFDQGREFTGRGGIGPAAAAAAPAAGEPQRPAPVALVEDHAARRGGDLLEPLERPACPERIS